VARRRLEHDRCRALCPPRRLGGTEAPGSAPLPVAGALLRGLPASRGTARGPARLVRSAQEFAVVRPGDVLVAPVAFPSWLALFGIVAGLVTDVGGPLSHGAVLAREFGLPAVVGTGDATARIRDGSMVEVDGTLGEVRLLAAAS
jgi:pyruvate,water dikinase